MDPQMEKQSDLPIVTLADTADTSDQQRIQEAVECFKLADEYTEYGHDRDESILARWTINSGLRITVSEILEELKR